MLGRQHVGQFGRLVAIAHQNRVRRTLQRLPRQIAALQHRQLLLQFRGHAVQERLAPSDEDTGTRRMFGLGDQVGGGKFGRRRFVGDDDHFARSGDGIDVDFAEYLSLRQRHEQIARARRSCPPSARPRRRRRAPPPPARRRGDRLRVTPSSWHVASRSRLYEPNGVGGATTAISLHARRLGGHGGHQHRRGIRRRAAGHADAHPLQRQIALPQIAAVRARRPSRRGARSPAGTARCCRGCGGSSPETPGRPRRGPRPVRPAETRIVAAVSCLPSSLAVYSSTAASPRSRTSPQIRSTTCTGESGSPNTSIVFCRPASLTTSPLGR